MSLQKLLDAGIVKPEQLKIGLEMTFLNDFVINFKKTLKNLPDCLYIPAVCLKIIKIIERERYSVS